MYFCIIYFPVCHFFVHLPSSLLFICPAQRYMGTLTVFLLFCLPLSALLSNWSFSYRDSRHWFLYYSLDIFQFPFQRLGQCLYLWSVGHDGKISPSKTFWLRHRGKESLNILSWFLKAAICVFSFLARVKDVRVPVGPDIENHLLSLISLSPWTSSCWICAYFLFNINLVILM